MQFALERRNRPLIPFAPLLAEMLDNPRDDLPFQHSQVDWSIEIVNDWLTLNCSPLSRPITRYFICNWN
jgi:hypothetical protein